jgi:hypothetical protein
MIFATSLIVKENGVIKVVFFLSVVLEIRSLDLDNFWRKMKKYDKNGRRNKFGWEDALF